MKKFVTGLVLICMMSFGLSACATIGGRDTAEAFAAACDRANGIIRAVQVLADAGELSANQLEQFDDAKITVGVVCSQSVPTNIDEALVTTATVYVTLAKMLRD